MPDRPSARPTSAVGAHVFAARGLASGALAYAREIGAEAVQVFVSSARAWALSAGDPREDEAFRAGCAEGGVAVFVHAPYLVNLASPTQATLDRSVACLRHSLRRGAEIGAAGVVFHAGSAVDRRRFGAALASSRELLAPLLDEAGELGVRLLVEPTAGGGAALAATVDSLGRYLAAVGDHEALGVCVDTCHLYAAGHDVASPDGMRATLDALEKVLRPGQLALVHANDTKDPRGSRRDRHECVGLGRIGIEPFAVLFRHRLTAGRPVLVETPGDAAAHRRELAVLKALRDR